MTGGERVRSASLSSTPARSGCTVSTSRTGSCPSFSIRPIALWIVNADTSSPAFTSPHKSGMETGAPGRERTLNGVTSSCPCRFWR